MPNRSVGAIIVAALVLAFALGIANTAFAAPPEPTLGLAALHNKLDASPDGTLDGYMKTVVKGSTIATIHVTVLAITGDESPSSSLILFEATGPLITKYGGIVAGMSGSPIYVSDNGTDTIIGAVSYGDMFTLGGTGLATPIEAMEQLENTYAPSVQTLDTPVITAAGVFDRVIVTNDPQSFSGAAAQGALVAKPLSSVFIGGISPNSRPYKRLVTALTAKGISVVDLAAPLAASPGVGDQSFTTTLTAGASVAALAARGDLWVGGVGTVTYATTDTVLAFGHPADYNGATSLYMTNAWVDGIWPSLIQPYKVTRPTALRGTITQDRGAGILGVIGQIPAETTITAEATNDDTHETTTSAVYMPRQLLDTSVGDYGYYASAGAYIAGASLFDQYNTPGSASATTTIVFRDTDADKLYTVVIPDVFDDSYDVPSTLTNDVDWAVGDLQSTFGDDAYHFEILSIDVTSHISTHRNAARIVGVTVPGGVKTGANTAQVSLLVNHVPATQTVNVPFTVPAGMSTKGSLAAQSAIDAAVDSGTFPSMDDSSGPRASIAQIVTDLNSNIKGNVLSVQYSTTSAGDSSGSGDGPAMLTAARVPTSVASTVTTPWVLQGTSHGYTTTIEASMMLPTMDYNGFNAVSGFIDGADDPGTISIYGTPAGSSVASLLGTTTVNPDDGSFELEVDGLKTNTTIRVHVDATTTGWSSADTTVLARVRAKVALSSSASSVSTGHTVTLHASVWPAANAGAKVTFEYYAKKTWHKIATKTLASGLPTRASTSWKVPHGSTKVRVRFLGSGFNVATTSSTLTIKGK